MRVIGKLVEDSLVDCEGEFKAIGGLLWRFDFAVQVQPLQSDLVQIEMSSGT